MLDTSWSLWDGVVSLLVTGRVCVTAGAGLPFTDLSYSAGLSCALNSLVCWSPVRCSLSWAGLSHVLISLVLVSLMGWSPVHWSLPRAGLSHGLVSCACCADNQCLSSAGSVQQEQQSCPLTSSEKGQEVYKSIPTDRNPLHI